MPESYKYLNKTVYYLKESDDGYYYLAFIDVYAVNEKMLFNKDFSRCVATDSVFENYKEAQEYMKRLGIELYIDDKKIGFKKIYAAGADAR